MPIFAVTYDYHHDDAHVAQRDALRPEHRAWLGRQTSLRLSGPTDDDNGLLVFEGDSCTAVESLLDEDPFAVAGLLNERRVVGWTLVSGTWRNTLDLT